MKRHRLLPLLAALPLVAAAAPGTAPTSSLTATTSPSSDAPATTASTTTEAQRLQKFAISQCLMRAFPDSPVAADARRAAGGYVELGSSDADVYGEIVTTVDAWRSQTYHSKSGESLYVMQCLDLLDAPVLAPHLQP